MGAYIDGKDAFIKEHGCRTLLWAGGANEQISA